MGLPLKVWNSYRKQHGEGNEGSVLEGTTIDSGAHTPIHTPSSRAEDILQSFVQVLAGKPTSSALSQKWARDETSVQLPKDTTQQHA